MIANGMHNGTKGTVFAYGSTVAYECDRGFTLAGAAFLRCIARDQYQGAWSNPAPECRGDCLLCLSLKYLFFSFLCEFSILVVLQRNKPSMLLETASVEI